MNGYRSSTSSRSSNHTRNESYAAPPARVLVDGYGSAHGRMNGATYGSQPPGYGLYDANDPVSVHLLMENALGDSKSFEVLAPDDVDSIKKELSVLSNKIEATHRKLVMEMKVRDAASSMGRLQKPGMTNGAGRNAEEAEEAARKCDELGRELWQLEKREQQLARTILEHNAAVLQMTHKGFLKDKSETNGSAYLDGYEEFGDFAHYKPTELAIEDLHLGLGGDRSGGQDLEKQNELVMGIGRRVEDLNARMREVMNNSNISQPRDVSGSNHDPGNPDLLHGQLDFLEDCMRAMQRHSGSSVPSEEVKAAEAELQGLNFRLYQNLSRLDLGLTEPPEANGQSLALQTQYMSNAFSSILQQIDKSERYENVIGGLWKTMVPPQEADNFSLQQFSAKFQDMQVKFDGLNNQKEVLSRQIQQQREMNENADSSRDKKIQELNDQLDSTKVELDNTRQETNIHLQKFTSAMEELEAAKAKISQVEQQRGADESKALEFERKALEQERQAKSKLEDAKATLEDELEQLKEDLESKNTDFKKADESAKEMEAQFVRAQTELTIAKAELDSAHGTRAERAKEAAGDPVMQERIKKLESELHETISDYEAMTKQTIEYEKEREVMETTVDQLRDKVETLETQLSEERLNALGSPKGQNSSTDRGDLAATSAAVLRSEFRKMMKEQRAEHMKALKAEQDERRRLEASIRNLKKEQQSKT